MEKKIIANFVSFSFLLALGQGFFFTSYQLFLREKGLGLMEMNLINLSFMLANFILEIPTGAIADLFGRKKSVMLGCLGLSLSFLVYYFSDSFWLFVLAEVIGALGITCISGALEAWVVDSLKHEKYEGSLEKVFRLSEIRGLGVIIACLIGSQASEIDSALPWLMSSIACFLLSLFVLFNFKEHYFKAEKVSWSLAPIKNTMRDGINFGFRSKSIFWVIIFSAIVSLSMQPINMYWPLVLTDDFSFTKTYLGWVFSGITLSAYLGGQFSWLWQKVFKSEAKAIVWSQAITSGGVILAALSFGASSFMMFFLLHEFGRGLIQPLSRAYLNYRIESDKRATVLSFAAMISTFGSACGLLLSGGVAEAWSVRSAWILAGISLFLGVFLFLFFPKKEKQKEAL